MKQDVRPTKEQMLLGQADGWSNVEARRGYTTFQDGDTDFTYIARIDIMDTFKSDEEAVEQAKKDGFKFLKVTKKDIENSSDSITTKNVIDNQYNRYILSLRRQRNETKH